MVMDVKRRWSSRVLVEEGGPSWMKRGVGCKAARRRWNRGGVSRFALHMRLASGFAAAPGRAGPSRAPCSERPCQKGVSQQ